MLLLFLITPIIPHHTLLYNPRSTPPGALPQVSPAGSVGASQPSAERCPLDTRAPTKGSAFGIRQGASSLNPCTSCNSRNRSLRSLCTRKKTLQPAIVIKAAGNKTESIGQALNGPCTPRVLPTGAADVVLSRWYDLYSGFMTNGGSGNNKTIA